MTGMETASLLILRHSTTETTVPEIDAKTIRFLFTPFYWFPCKAESSNRSGPRNLGLCAVNFLNCCKRVGPTVAGSQGEMDPS